MKELLTVQRDLVFGHTDQGVALMADIYLPNTQGLRPGLLLIHGGGWQKGSKEAYQEWGPLLAQAGFAAIAINYRLSSANSIGWPGALDDVRQAFRWMVNRAQNFQIDPQRIGIIGDSAGGQLAALLTLTHYVDSPSGIEATIRALVGAYGAYDLTPGQGGQENYLLERPDHALEHFFGATFQEAPERYLSASPINYVAQAQTVVVPGEEHYWFVPFPPGEGRTLQEYPNTVVAPQVLEFLRKAL